MKANRYEGYRLKLQWGCLVTRSAPISLRSPLSRSSLSPHPDIGPLVQFVPRLYIEQLRGAVRHTAPLCTDVLKLQRLRARLYVHTSLGHRACNGGGGDSQTRLVGGKGGDRSQRLCVGHERSRKVIGPMRRVCASRVLLQRQ